MNIDKLYELGIKFYNENRDNIFIDYRKEIIDDGEIVYDEIEVIEFDIPVEKVDDDIYEDEEAYGYFREAIIDEYVADNERNK